MDVITQGLILSLVGLVLTFTALATLILVISVLQALFRPRPVAPPVETHGAAEALAEASAQGAPLEEIAAAVAVAISYLRADDRRRSQLGAALALGPGRWWHTHAGLHDGRHNS